MASNVQILEAYLEFLLRPCQRALVDHWPRPTPAITAPFFAGVDTIQGIATLLAYQHPLQQCRFDRSAGRMMLVLGQLFLCQSKSLFTHQRRNGHFDPVRARPITMTVASVRGTVPLTQRPRDALSFRLFGFAEARFAFIGRVAQQSPHRRSFPASFSRSR